MFIYVMCINYVYCVAYLKSYDDPGYKVRITDHKCDSVEY